jgi:hypothetical protein|nr:MAG TPA: hypothetical protein [Caudoviricetes sp.]
MNKILRGLTVLVIIILIAGGMAANTTKAKQTFRVTNILHESTDNFKLSAGEIGIEFSNGSWAIVNEKDNIYIFQAVELGDYEQQFETLEQLKNCIKTYSSIKNNGLY